MSTAQVRMVLAAMQDTAGAASGLPVDAVATLACCSVPDARAVLKHLLALEPAWVDGEVVPEAGLVWFLTAVGREAADLDRRRGGPQRAPLRAAG